MSSVVPEGWVRIDLEEGVSALVSGQSPNRKENRATGDAFGILKTTAIDWGRFDEKKNQEVLDDYKPNKKHLVLENDILITKAGPTHRVGVVAQARNLRSNVLLSGKMTALRVNYKFTPDFLTYALCQEEAQNHLKANTTGMASSQTNFTHDALLRVPILSPPLPEQKKIASILTSVDEVIENTSRQIDKLQDLKKATMNELLTKGIGHTEFKDSELGRIPKSWEVKKFSHITHLITKGTTPTSIGFSFSESGINFIKVESIVSDGNIDPAKFSYVEENVHNKLRRSQICKEDILITIAGTIGKLAIAEQKFLPANTNQALAIVRLKKEIVRPLFAFYFLQGWYIKTLIGRSQTVGAQPNVSLAQIANFPIPLIDVMEQDLIVESLRSFDKAIADVKRKLSQTQSLKKSLMQDLLTGKVRVTVN